MNEQDRNTILDAMESAAAAYGCDFYKVVRFIARCLESQRPMLEAFQSRETLDAYLASVEGLTDEQAKMTVALFQAAPELLHQTVLKAVQEAAAAHSGETAGRPQKLTPEIKREIVAELGKLYLEGVPLGVAQGRMAQRFCVSRRSVQKAWKQRKQLAAQPFQTMDDIWKYMAR